MGNEEDGKVEPSLSDAVRTVRQGPEPKLPDDALPSHEVRSIEPPYMVAPDYDANAKAETVLEGLLKARVADLQASLNSARTSSDNWRQRAEAAEQRYAGAREEKRRLSDRFDSSRKRVNELETQVRVLRREIEDQTGRAERAEARLMARDEAADRMITSAVEADDRPRVNVYVEGKDNTFVDISVTHNDLMHATNIAGHALAAANGAIQTVEMMEKEAMGLARSLFDNAGVVSSIGEEAERVIDLLRAAGIPVPKPETPVPGVDTDDVQNNEGDSE